MAGVRGGESAVISITVAQGRAHRRFAIAAPWTMTMGAAAGPGGSRDEGDCGGQ